MSVDEALLGTIQGWFLGIKISQWPMVTKTGAFNHTIGHNTLVQLVFKESYKYYKITIIVLILLSFSK